MYSVDFVEVYRRDKEVIDHYFSKGLISKLLGERQEEMERGDAWEPPDANQLKRQYNKLLQKEKELLAFLDGHDYQTPLTGAKADEYGKITRQMDEVLSELGIKEATGEIENGFEVADEDKPSE
jgi:hypothetical protein